MRLREKEKETSTSRGRRGGWSSNEVNFNYLLLFFALLPLSLLFLRWLLRIPPRVGPGPIHHWCQLTLTAHVALAGAL